MTVRGAKGAPLHQQRGIVGVVIEEAAFPSGVRRAIPMDPVACMRRDGALPALAKQISTSTKPEESATAAPSITRMNRGSRSVPLITGATENAALNPAAAYALNSNCSALTPLNFRSARCGGPVDRNLPRSGDDRPTHRQHHRCDGSADR